MITPKSKILEILTKYPALEEKIFDYAPAFKALNNTTLLNVVLKVTTLQQIAVTNNLNISELVNDLRQVAGIDKEITKINKQMTINTTRPDWLTSEKNITVFDVREMLERGEHPVNQVMAELNTLSEGSVYQIIAPFMPGPLIEKAAGIGFTCWSNKINDQLYEIYFFHQY